MSALEWDDGGFAPGWPKDDRRLVKLVVEVVALATRLEPRDIFTATRNAASASRARQIAIYLAHTGLNWTQARTGSAFGRDRSTVSYACTRVEDLRENPAFDARLSGLETWLRALPDVEAPL